MKKFLASISTALLSLPVMVAAAVPPENAPNIDTMTALNNLTNWLFSILIVVAAIFLIRAAYTFITAEGDSDKISSAKTDILYVLIAVAVALLARGLVGLVKNIINP